MLVILMLQATDDLDWVNRVPCMKSDLLKQTPRTSFITSIFLPEPTVSLTGNIKESFIICSPQRMASFLCFKINFTNAFLCLLRESFIL